MKTKFVEVTQDAEVGLNWGKMMLCRFELEEWGYRSEIDPRARLLDSQGWGRNHILIVDLATGEGAVFKPGGYAHADLNKHAIWCCPMFEPFLEYLYDFVREGRDPFEIPSVVELPDAEPAMSGYRRPGPVE